MIRHDMATRPQGVYGSTKVWGEAIGRHYANTFCASASATSTRRIVPRDAAEDHR
ncbi:MAG: hypothetical protein OXU77_16905 [Gammaproteobacteria bacterium]|nr:hypothetical protein [Gammaproteobacteria bacterium]MDE0440722.1 hypothetical protein [Gammaproteobacteria bacterium]